MHTYKIVSDEKIVRIRSYCDRDTFFIFEDQIKKNSDPFTSLAMAPVSLLRFIADSESENLSVAREIARKLLKK